MAWLQQNELSVAENGLTRPRTVHKSMSMHGNCDPRCFKSGLSVISLSNHPAPLGHNDLMTPRMLVRSPAWAW
jgi:hypothetical protein